jgi:hypothetical protein
MIVEFKAGRSPSKRHCQKRGAPERFRRPCFRGGRPVG